MARRTETKTAIVPALFGQHKVPLHYFITPRCSGLPLGYFDPWWKRWIDGKELMVLLVVLVFLVVVSVK